MSAIPPKADIDERRCHVRFVPKADIKRYATDGSRSQSLVRQSRLSQAKPEAPFTLLLCCTDLPVILFLSACFEAATLEDGVRDNYFAAAREIH